MIHGFNIEKKNKRIIRDKMNKKKRLIKSTKSLQKTEKKLIKAREELIWIKNNPHIHILNYPFYKFIRWVKHEKSNNRT